MKNSRRNFLASAAGIISVLTFSRTALADMPAKVMESDPAAQALGYKENATEVDTAKYKTYAAGQVCGSCALFSGNAGDAMGPCKLFQGKLVSSKGWCSAYAKKA